MTQEGSGNTVRMNSSLWDEAGPIGPLWVRTGRGPWSPGSSRAARPPWQPPVVRLPPCPDLAPCRGPCCPHTCSSSGLSCCSCQPASPRTVVPAVGSSCPLSPEPGPQPGWCPGLPAAPQSLSGSPKHQVSLPGTPRVPAVPLSRCQLSLLRSPPLPLGSSWGAPPGAPAGGCVSQAYPEADSLGS